MSSHMVDAIRFTDEEFADWIESVALRFGRKPETMPVSWYELFYGLMLSPREAVELISSEYEIAPKRRVLA